MSEKENDWDMYLHCPICGQYLVLPAKDGVILGNKSCDGCKNKFLILVTKDNQLMIQAKLVEPTTAELVE